MRTEKTLEMSKPYRVLLYYNYVPISNPAQYREQHHLFCIENNLLGRVVVAEEGLNGTVSGLEADCERYMAYLRADERFANTDFKIEQTSTHVFKKLNVRLKKEIVNSDLPVDPRQRTGTHLSPTEFKALKNDSDVILVDMRSHYEHEVGRFKNAVTFEMDNLRELPEMVDSIAHLKNKKIITYCTGGIKCEKASAYLLDQGFENVYQLHGGIIKYALETGGEDFDGKCYVFDNRLAVDVNTVNPVVVSVCFVCGTPSERMVNCANANCNKHVPMCEKCGHQMQGCCTDACTKSPNKRPYDGSGVHPKKTNHYNPRQGYKNIKRTNKTVTNQP